jgi:hypothetical protein
VHAAVRGLAQQAEAGGVEVKARQRDQQPLDDLGGGGTEGRKRISGSNFSSSSWSFLSSSVAAVMKGVRFI